LASRIFHDLRPAKDPVRHGETAWRNRLNAFLVMGLRSTLSDRGMALAAPLRQGRIACRRTGFRPFLIPFVREFVVLFHSPLQ